MVFVSTLAYCRQLFACYMTVRIIVGIHHHLSSCMRANIAFPRNRSSQDVGANGKTYTNRTLQSHPKTFHQDGDRGAFRSIPSLLSMRHIWPPRHARSHPLAISPSVYRLHCRNPHREYSFSIHLLPAAFLHTVPPPIAADKIALWPPRIRRGFL